MYYWKKKSMRWTQNTTTSNTVTRKYNLETDGLSEVHCEDFEVMNFFAVQIYDLGPSFIYSFGGIEDIVGPEDIDIVHRFKKVNGDQIQ